MRSSQKRSTKFQSTPIVRGLMNQKFSEISNQKSKWTDPLFPPDESSLYSTKSDHKNYKLPEIPKFLKESAKTKFLSQFALDKKDHEYQWMRLTDVYDVKDLNVIKTPVKEDGLSSDVIQGELGDCYFLSALAALGENPERIKKLFPNAKLCENGVSEVQIYLHGDPTRITLDDYVPFLSQPGFEPQIAFAGINEKTNNIWPLLLEKAWAKCNLSYEDIASGNSAEAFEFLCPAPFDTYYHNADTKTLFSLIESSIKKGYLVCSDITETANTNLDNLSKMGLITNHAYSVIDTAVLKDSSNGNEIRLIKIRNPWNTNEWLGDWSDGSRKWTEEFKQTIGLEEKEDGIFWMSYEDFTKFYTSTHICLIHDDYNFVSKKFLVGKDKPFNLVCVNIPKDTSGFFEVNMKNTRIYKNLKGLEEFENPYCVMTVFKKVGDNFEYLGSNSGRNDRLYVECEDMVKGKYYICVTFPKKKDEFEISNDYQYTVYEKMTYRIGVYSPFESLDITQDIEGDEEILTKFLNDIISDIANKSENKYTFINEGEKTSWRVIEFNDSRSGFGYIYYKNDSEAFIRERFTITELENINIMPMLKDGQFPKLEASEEEEEVEYEDPQKRLAIRSLRSNTKLKSSVDIIERENSSEEISPDNPVEIQINVAPHTSCIVLLQKSEEDSSIDFTSEICFDYLPHVLLAEERFRPKRFMLKYNDKPVEVYECVTEHNTGVLFQYKNKTKDLKVSIVVQFSDLDNLYLSLFSDDIDSKEDKQLTLRPAVEGKFRDDDDNDEVSLVIPPGQTKFFGIRAVDDFKKFSYSCHIDYHFNLFKGLTGDEITNQAVTEEFND